VPEEPFGPSLRLQGRHVALEPLDASHIEALAPALLDRETVQYLREAPDPDLPSARRWLEQRIADGKKNLYRPFATVLRATGRPVGSTSFFRLDRASRNVEIGGTWIARPLWRTPVNSESKWLLLRYAFETGGMHRVQLQTDLRNVRSRKAIQDLGALPEAQLREDVLLAGGYYRTSAYFSILEGEWPAVRQRLETRLTRAWEPPRAFELPVPSAPPHSSSGPAVPRPPIEFRPPVSLVGRYVRLDPLRTEDLPELIRAGADPAIWTLLRIRHGDTPEGMAGLVDDLLALQSNGEVLAFTVRRLSDRAVLGIARYLDIDRANRWVEVGTWLNPSVWRTPVNTDLKLVLFRHAFDTEGVHRVQLKTDVRNERSERAIERLGAVDEGVRRDHYRFPDGSYRTSRYYSVLASEWPAVHDRLEEYLRRPWNGSV
jgi:N-acetyltransferase